MNKIKNLGQVFTSNTIVKKMISLLKLKNSGNVLEPSCGDGAFSKNITNCTAIEFDGLVCPNYAINMDFFQYSTNNKFYSIIGNPPFVKFNNIIESTKTLLDSTLFDNRTNLYMFFIHKSILHLKNGGELVFITPRDFLKATASVKLNEFIYNTGTITDIIDLGDKQIFKGVTPNCVIFRFEKDNFSRITNTHLKFTLNNGQLLFLKDEYNIKLSDIFYIKVGAVSGADDIFIHTNGNVNFVCSETIKTKKLRKMIFDKKHKALVKHKNRLINRKIKKFDESNWWSWGRKHHISDSPRIYVNCKTRNNNPFFTHRCKNYDGSVLALFPHNKMLDIKECIKELNKVDWSSLGFMCGNRFIFSQRALQNTLLPDNFEKYTI